MITFFSPVVVDVAECAAVEYVLLVDAVLEVFKREVEVVAVEIASDVDSGCKTVILKKILNAYFEICACARVEVVWSARKCLIALVFAAEINLAYKVVDIEVGEI